MPSANKNTSTPDTAPQVDQLSVIDWASATLKTSCSALLLAASALTGGAEVGESHGGGCGCPGCLPPPRVRLLDHKKEDENGEPEE